jgi:hypothetical protein
MITRRPDMRRSKGTQTTRLWRSRCGHEGRALDRDLPDFHSLVSAPAVVGLLIRPDLLVWSCCVLLPPPDMMINL